MHSGEGDQLLASSLADGRAACSEAERVQSFSARSKAGPAERDAGDGDRGAAHRPAETDYPVRLGVGKIRDPVSAHAAGGRYCAVNRRCACGAPASTNRRPPAQQRRLHGVRTRGLNASSGQGSHACGYTAGTTTILARTIRRLDVVAAV